MALVGAGRERSVVAVVPTLGRSPLLGDSLRALRATGAAAPRVRLEVVVVAQATTLPPELAALADEVIELPERAGFTGATNRGIAARPEADLVATVNDDAVVAPGWLAALVEALETHPDAAAAQGWNLTTWDGRRALDGRGLQFNHWLQAVQIGHGEVVPDASGSGHGEVVPAPRGVPDASGSASGAGGIGPVDEVPGVSATAALYRKTALDEVAGPDGVFDERLGSYYEDAELALRLRAAGWTALSVPAARAEHASSLTARDLGTYQTSRIYGNRYLVVAQGLGRDFRRALPRLVGRDLLDLARALVRLDRRRIAGIPAGWWRAGRGIGRFRHDGEPVLFEVHR